MSTGLQEAIARIAATTSAFLAGPPPMAAGDDELSAIVETKKQLFKEHAELLQKEEAMHRAMNKLTAQDKQKVMNAYYNWLYRGAK